MTEENNEEQEKIEGLPLINQMGVDAAWDRQALTDLTRSQMQFVYEQLGYYLGHTEREWQEGDREHLRKLMPHEWGSMDTYDDMRNSMRAATEMLDNLLAPEMFLPEELKGQHSYEGSEHVIRNWLRKMAVEEVGLCAWSNEVHKFIDAGDENAEWFDEMTKPDDREE